MAGGTAVFETTKWQAAVTGGAALPEEWVVGSLSVWVADVRGVTHTSQSAR